MLQQTEPGSKDQLPILESAVAAKVTHAFYPAMPGTQTAVIQLDAQLYRLTDELLRIECRGLVDHVDRVTRHTPQSFLSMGTQRIQLLPLRRRDVQQASGLAQRRINRSQCDVSNGIHS
ncbi:hypothetical protein D3C84_650490 [compost metagenome]